MELKDFSAVRVSLASPDIIRSWSYGEVTKPETINYRRLRPEKDGLFCEAIFGPTKDWQCYCGKYKKIRYKGIICDKCGVEVAPSRVRRERMGHIELAAPVAHIWYTRRVPSYLGLLLNSSRRNLDRVLYFTQYIITHVDEDARLKALRKIDEEEEREKARRDKLFQEGKEQLQARMDDGIEKLEAALEEERKKLEKEQEQATDRLMSEANALQGRLESMVGEEAPEAIALSSVGLTVEKGEAVGKKHLNLLKRMVKEEIDRIAAEGVQQRKDHQLLIDAKKDQLQYAMDEELEALRKQLNEEIEATAKQLLEDRNELEDIRERRLLNELRYRELKSKWGQVFSAGMGAEALYDLLTKMDLDSMAADLRREIQLTRSGARRKKAIKQLQIVEALRKSGNRPEWMILTVLPVIPPDLRPMVQLDGGRFATSDLNDLYRRVINRNNRLKRLLELRAPDIIVQNEKRMLQEAVDSLIDNSRRGKAVSLRGRRQLKSLSDMLKGKRGRFRRNLLGKRVDYSGRSVIVIGPHLRLHQCGLPKSMALELFRPFVMRKLVENYHAINIKGAKRIIEQGRPEVWEVLEEVIKDRPVLLNRAPTLHRLGIQAFEPVLVEGNAIQIHSLVCAAFNADFDGDQMAVHVPLSEEAKREAMMLMLSSRNLLLPANGEPVVGPSKDMVLGCYYMTMEKDGESRGEGKVFADMEEVSLAYSLGKVDLHARIKLAVSPDKMLETTVGRGLFNEVLPQELRFKNHVMDKKALKALIADCYQLLGQESTADLVDRIKDIGFRFATVSGLTIAIDDLTIPEDKERILGEASSKVGEIERQYRRGLITQEEKYRKTVELWAKATEDVTAAVKAAIDPQGPIGVMAQSGATKGEFQPIRQLAGMRGLMADPSGRIIALPIQSNFREGLTALEYFISTHGARKGLADTALRTADAGYLTRRLVDVAQDVIINAEDCGTRVGILIDNGKSGALGGSFAERIHGRVLSKPVTVDTDKVTDVRKREAEHPVLAGSRVGDDVEEGKPFSKGAVLIGNSGRYKDVIAEYPGTVLIVEGREEIERCDRWLGLWAEVNGEESLSGKKKKKLAEEIAEERIWWLRREGKVSKKREAEVRSDTLNRIERHLEGYRVSCEKEPTHIIDSREAYLCPECGQHICPVCGECQDQLPGFGELALDHGCTSPLAQVFGRLVVEYQEEVHWSEVLLEEGTLLDDQEVRKIVEAGVSRVYVRSPLTCELDQGICAKCYGHDLARGGMVSIGEAVGIIAAQSIGEPGTQLTLRTFHTGGVAAGGDITQGLPRVQELFEARDPKGEAIISDIEGCLDIIQDEEGRKLRTTSAEIHHDEIQIPKGYKRLVKDGHRVTKGDVIAEPKEEGEEPVVASQRGEIVVDGRKAYLRYEEREEREYELAATARLRQGIEPGNWVKAGEQLTEGSKNPHELLRVLGHDATQVYLLEEVQNVYRSQGVTINDKHIEAILRQMLRHVKVKTSGDTELLPGELIDRFAYQEINDEIVAAGGEPATAENVLLGITKAALSTDSFLSAASFQHTISVLAKAAIEGKVDKLRGLKENVIIGKLIPAGTGFPRRLQGEIFGEIAGEGEELRKPDEVEGTGRTADTEEAEGMQEDEVGKLEMAAEGTVAT